MGDGNAMVGPSPTLTGSVSSSIEPTGESDKNIVVLQPQASSTTFTPQGPNYAVQYRSSNSIAGSSGLMFDAARLILLSGASRVLIGTDTASGNSNDNLTALGYQAMASLTGNYCTAIGLKALSTSTVDNSVAVGEEALYTSTGSLCAALGYYAGRSNTGNYGTFIGCQAGMNNTALHCSFFGYAAGNGNSGTNCVGVGSVVLLTNAGNYCTAAGYSALDTNTGDDNTAMGYEASYNASGSNNVSLGNYSLHSSNASNAVAIGYYSAYRNAGSDCVYIGYYSGGQLCTGVRNTAIGSNSAYETAALTGWSNTFLGYNASYGGNTAVNNATALGADVTVAQSNTVILGNNCNVGIGTSTPTSKLQVVGLSAYAGNAAAIAGGLTAGAFYRNGDNVCVVH